MTGQIKTSFKQSVAPGCYQATAQTIPDLLTEVRVSSGCMGSVYLNANYTSGAVTIPGSAWYNFLYVPHRSGGENGQEISGNDNTRYGNLTLWPMTGVTSNKQWIGEYIIKINSSNSSPYYQVMAVYTAGRTTETVTTTGLATSWTVHRYPDGECEAYAVTGSTGYPMTSQYTNGWYYAATQTLSGLPFASVSYAQVDRCAGSSSGGLITASVYNLTTSQIQWYAFDTRSETVNCSFSIRIVGKWK